MLKKYLIILISGFVIFNSNAQFPRHIPLVKELISIAQSKPCVYWWWFAGKIKQEDVLSQLIWLKQQNIGGVLIYYLYPLNKLKKDTIHYAPRYDFLGKEFIDISVYTKHKCDSLALSCNIICGTGWPFGGSFVSRDDATLTWTNDGLEPMETFNITWEWPKKGYVIDHMSQTSVDDYFNKVGKALIPVLSGHKTYLACDSWEIAEFEPIWTVGFDKLFRNKYGYDITPYVSGFTDVNKKDTLLRKIIPCISDLYDLNDKSLYDVRYDYYKLVSDLVINNFYKHFTKLCNAVGSGSLVECNGSPTDIIDAYASVDIPMTEAMLYEPNYSKIPASAECLSGKTELASETFTCAYGFREKYGYKEQVADMKLVADAMFANGVNKIYWHGFALNPKGYDTVRYYATVDVSPKSKLMHGFSKFNAYMTDVSAYMRRGNNWADVAVYLPMEDRFAEGIYTQDFLDKLRPEERYWHFSKYQMRYEYFPKELEGYPMLWINSRYLTTAKYKGGLLDAGQTTFKAVYIDVNYLPYETLCAITEQAKKGLPVCLKRDPIEPGRNKHTDYNSKLAELKSYNNVNSNYKKVFKTKPLIEGEDIPDYWTRKDGDNIYIFFANPKTKELKYPVKYGQSLQTENIIRKIKLNINGNVVPVNLVFEPYQSIMMKLEQNGNFNFINLTFIPETPDVK